MGEGNNLVRKRLAWVLAFLALIVSAYAVPFLALDQVPRFYGAFLYWVGFALLAIIMMFRVMRRWNG
ncbi:MAG: hypothetical protein H5U02_08850 [Clostridia bacterium]|nr:hypothetical protein [Clostridia bacterium]